MVLTLSSHVCSPSCSTLLSVFSSIPVSDSLTSSQPHSHPRSTTASFSASDPSPEHVPDSTPFPPAPLSISDYASFVSDWSTAISAPNILESACAVCARLTLTSLLSPLSEGDINLGPITRPGEGITRCERFSASEPVREIPGPILHAPGIVQRGNYRVLMLCPSCVRALRDSKMPHHALANGRWVGDQPLALAGLSYVEQLIIARHRHSFCVAQVARSGQRFLATNVIIFGQPVPRLYAALPPPRSDIEQCLAILFVGTAKPTDEDIRRTPFLVRRPVVVRALQWLQLNNPLYADIEISYANLDTYPTDSPPVCVIHRPRSSTSGPENLAVYQTSDERAVTDGPSSFVVHTLHAPDLARMTYEAKIALAVRHFEDGNGVLAYGHDVTPESMYHNPELFPRMFPWLYPYGLGGFENERMSVRLDRSLHIRSLLMMPDRRFQNDRCFAFIVFNHEQIRSSSQGGFLLTSRKNFASVADTILKLDREALNSIIERGSKGDYVRPQNPAEKQCFELMTYVDHIAGHVKGSNTSRKYQRNEIRSLIYAKGAPVFFVTFAPADFKNPLCLVYCGENIDLSDRLPLLRNSNDRLRAIANNPVGAARFFDKVVQLFVDCILRVGDSRPGLFGSTDAYYGTVEAQGRLTLHLHTLVWIKGSPPPQVIRDRLLAESDFETRLLHWLSECVTGDFLGSTGSELASKLEDKFVQRMPSGEMKIARRMRASVRDPATTLPLCPPVPSDAKALQDWYAAFVADTDELVFCSNRHDPSHGKGCWRVKGQYCRARFPRPLLSTTDIDKESGAIRFAKSEPWLNTYNPVLSQCIRANTDVACILSGTQIKAILAYITDYITKSSLSTHTFFEIVRSVLDRNAETFNDSSPDREQAARTLLVKIVNAMSAASEIGGPAVCSYLLGIPDHYTGHQFKVFYWYSFLLQVRRDLESTVTSPDPVPQPETGETQCTSLSAESVMLAVEGDSVVGVQKVHDYVFRPPAFSSYSLYDFYCSTDVRKLKKNELFRDSASSTKATAYQFLPAHPLAASHGVYLRTAQSLYVLNFVGRSLPRADKGDREEYAAVMLMLFRPGGWRTGQDLLAQVPSFSAAFEMCSFPPELLQVMANMNILYECLDARDDYSAQRRAMQIENPNSDSPFQCGLSDSLDSRLFEGEYEYTETSLIDCLHNGAVGQKTARYRKEAALIRSLIPLDPLACVESPISTPHVRRTYPKWSAAEWKLVVSTAKQAYIDRHESPPALATASVGRPETSHLHYVIDNIVRTLTIADLNKFRSFKIDITRGPQDPHLLLLHTVLEKFTLNGEQTRAFLLTATHLHHHDPKPIRMHLGGMAGTGKSRVLLSLICFLDARDEGYRLLILGPTGSSAALIGGSTYHSALGINAQTEHNRTNSASVAKLRSRLARVDLVFIDEVSMISCLDLMRINRQLVKSRSECNDIFGGRSVILAGDFAQLPPPGIAPPLYSNNVGAWSSAASQNSQECAMGKALWHEFTTVVILRENMRQRGISNEDVQFRVALDNMRYCRCTAADEALFRTRMWASPASGNEPTNALFRDVSIITACNAHRDTINHTKASQFATRTGKRLYRFYSLDQWGKSQDPVSIRRAQSHYDSIVDPLRQSNEIDPKVQHQLWAIPPTLTEHHAGILELCEGMPVLLKVNEATELCATNGAEAEVVCWDSHLINGSISVLDTLYVRLINPPRSVKLDGLDENVIPLTRARKTVKCTLPVDDLLVTIQREQVMILPNFAMTDFASQGRTRPHNVCHLEYCKNHQSIYTCLSRSSSLQGTLIIGPLDFSKLRGGGLAAHSVGNTEN